MKKTVVVYGSSTGTCEAIANTIASKLGVEAINVADLTDAVISDNDNLLLGTSTWALVNCRTTGTTAWMY